MGSITEPLLSEFRQEAATTRRVLERVPEKSFAWKPHAKAMTLGQLASHIATVPAGVAMVLQNDTFDVNQGNFVPPQPKDLQEVLTAFEQSIRGAEEFLEKLPDDRARAPWRLVRGEQELMTVPRATAIRNIMMNHWYHHRGQLSVYLRFLDVPLPSIYGPSADENPFA
ncbi:MAG TPA: DinB family protein [Candidatus Angelobacter sp.]|nr:DinB family protein [Candidatus Angelobacter sp.]